MTSRFATFALAAASRSATASRATPHSCDEPGRPASGSRGLLASLHGDLRALHPRPHERCEDDSRPFQVTGP
jgi:hypothetical protein